MNYDFQVQLGRLFVLVSLVVIFPCDNMLAQSLLDKRISIDIEQKPLAEALNDIGNKGGFYFSYNGNILQRDSLVSLHTMHEKVSNILSKLFNDSYKFQERKNHIIIGLGSRLRNLAIVNTDIINSNNTHSISGLVIDEQTKHRLGGVSIYEKQQLVSTLTDEHGYFSLKFRARHLDQINLTASKQFYKDTSINFLQTVYVADNYYLPKNSSSDRNNDIENRGLGRFFISAKHKVQSLNIPDFFAQSKFQVSLSPGLSSHGMFNSQIINKLSLNVIGGYTAGSNGLEVGGLFNINKTNTKYFQLAGVFNSVGGDVIGFQVGGVQNQVFGSIKGLQIAGFFNQVKGDVSGMQISSLNNEAAKLRGVQIGIVNTVDTSKGISLGLVNIIRNGFYKVLLSTNNITNTNLTLKTGTHDFYTSLILGTNLSANNKMYTFGMGVGHDFIFNPILSLSAEANYQFAYTGSWDDRWAQAKLLMNIQLAKHISFVAGPTYNKYSYTGSRSGYQDKFTVPENSRQRRNPVKRWIGWEAGIAFDGVFRPGKQKNSVSNNWYLGLATTAGIGWDDPWGFTGGGELFLQRDLDSRTAGVLSVGYTYFITGDRVVSPYVLSDGSKGLFSGNNFRALPIKAGIRAYPAKRVFLMGEIGNAFGLNSLANRWPVDHNGMITPNINKIENSPLYVVSAGYTFVNNFEANITFEDYTKFRNIKRFAIRLAYRIKLNK